MFVCVCIYLSVTVVAERRKSIFLKSQLYSYFVWHMKERADVLRIVVCMCVCVFSFVCCSGGGTAEGFAAV